MKKKIVFGISLVVGLFMILYSGQIFDLGSLFIPQQIYMAICLAAALAMTFVIHRSHKVKKNKIPWYDYVFIVASVVSVGYAAIFYKDLLAQTTSGTASALITVLFIVSALLILEATRRLVGFAFTLIVLVFLLQTMYCNYLPWLFHGKGYPLDWMAYALYIVPEGIFSTPLQVSSTIVVAFLLFGNLLLVSGAGKLFVDLPLGLFGQVRGGPAKVAVVASALFGTMTGSAVANVATTGAFTIPLMKKVGYDADFAGAVEAVSSTGSQFTPPVMGGIVFIMAQWLGLSYIYICFAAAIPAFLYYFNEYMVLDFQAARSGIKGLAKSELPSVRKTLNDGWPFLLPLIILVILLAVFRLEVGVAGLYSSISIVAVSWLKKESRIGFNRLGVALADTFKQFIMIGIACAAAGLLVGSMNLTGISMKLGVEFLNIAGGNMVILLILSAIAAFIMGLGMPALPIYVLLAVLLAPTLITAGVPAINAHFFIIVSAILNLITPPVALACFAAAAIAGGDMMRTGMQAMRIGLMGFFLPFWFVYRPATMLQGSIQDIFLSFGLAVLFVISTAAATMGYGLRNMSLWERILAGLAGFSLLPPVAWLNYIGLAIILLLFAEQLILHRRDKANGAPKPVIFEKQASKKKGVDRKWMVPIDNKQYTVEVDYGILVSNEEETKEVLYQRDGKLVVNGKDVQTWEADEMPKEVSFDLGGKPARLKKMGLFSKQLELFVDGQKIKPVKLD